MTDREMLELAAKAAGIKYDPEASKPHPVSGAWFGLWLTYDREPTEYDRRRWNPLKDDGDALRLAAKLKIDIEWQATNPFPEPRVEAYQRNHEGSYFCSDEHEDDYRRAIVRAAAEIGKNPPGAYTDLEGTIPAKPGDPVALLRPLGEDDLAAMMRKEGKP